MSILPMELYSSREIAEKVTPPRVLWLLTADSSSSICVSKSVIVQLRLSGKQMVMASFRSKTKPFLMVSALPWSVPEPPTARLPEEMVFPGNVSTRFSFEVRPVVQGVDFDVPSVLIFPP